MRNQKYIRLVNAREAQEEREREEALGFKRYSENPVFASQHDFELAEAYAKRHGQSLPTIQGKKKRGRRPSGFACDRKQWKKYIRLYVLTYYGPECQCPGCDEDNLRILTLDHIYNDGNTHRKKVTDSMYEWAWRNGMPPIFQTLCYNCNIGKHLNNGLCPHMGENKRKYKRVEYRF